MEPLYVTPAGNMRLYAIVMAGLIAIDLVVVAVLFAFASAEATIITLAVMLVAIVVIWLILPGATRSGRTDCASNSRPGAGTSASTTSRPVRPSCPFEPYGFAGVRFATAPSQAITILRHNANMITHPNIVISPAAREEFLRQLERAMGRNDPGPG